MQPRSYYFSIRKVTTVLPLSLLAIVANSQTVAPAPAQAAPPESASTFSIKAYAEEVVVDVVVTDKKGSPVQSLSQDRFQVLEDGKPQQFRVFQEHGVGNNAQPAQASHPLPQHIYSNLALMGTEDRHTPLVLLLDGLNTPVKDQMTMRKQIVSFLKQIPPGTHVALLALNQSMRLLANFTTDTSVIAAAVEDTKSIRPSGMLYRDNHFEDPFSTAAVEQQSQAQGDSYAKVTDARRDETRMEVRVRTTLDALDALSKYLAGFPGRKNVVWFSASFPLDVSPKTVTSWAGSVEDSSGSGSNSDPRQIAGDFIFANYSQEVRHTTSLLAKSRIAVYPVDVRGVELDNFYDSETGKLPKNSSSSIIAQSQRELQRDFVENHASEQSAMKDIARDTGGEAFLNGNDQSAALGKVLRAAADYYEIAYVPAHARDGKYHTINVKVDSSGVRAAYRQDYFGDDPAKLQQNRKATVDPFTFELQVGRPPSTQIPFYIQAMPLVTQPDLSDRSRRNGDFGVKIDGPVVRYAIDWNINLAALQTTSNADGHYEGKISFGGIAYDSEGKLRNSLLNTTEINLTRQRFAYLSTHGLTFHEELDLPITDVVLRVALIDRVSGRTGSFEIPLSAK